MNRVRNAFAHVQRWLNPTSLQYQILARTLYVMFAVLLLVGILQYVFLSQFLFRNTAKDVIKEIRSLPPQTWNAPMGQHGNRNFPPNWGMSTPITSIAIVGLNDQMQTLNVNSNHGPVHKLSNGTYQTVLQSGEASWQIAANSNGKREIFVLIPLMSASGPVGVIQATSPVEQLDAVLRSDMAIYVLLGLFAFIGGIAVLVPTVRKTMRPLSTMVHTVTRINAGNLEERFTSERPQAEIALLEDSFNAMLERLRESFEMERRSNEKMRQFLADASHELRTPLTSIHGFIEVLLRGAAGNAEQLKRALTSMHGESERMKKLVNDLILLARLDGEPQFDLKRNRLAQLVEEMEPQLRVLAGERTVTFNIDANVVAQFDTDRIKQVLLNLFHNAVQHTDATQGNIAVSVSKSGEGALLTVSDNGTGISDQHLPHLFERFYRVDSARARAHGGAGLGLSISKSIIDAHQGHITCESVYGEGTSFLVWIPS